MITKEWIEGKILATFDVSQVAADIMDKITEPETASSDILIKIYDGLKACSEIQKIQKKRLDAIESESIPNNELERRIRSLETNEDAINEELGELGEIAKRNHDRIDSLVGVG